MTDYLSLVLPGVVCILLVILGVYFRKKRISSSGVNLPYVHKGDIEGQKAYNLKKNPIHQSLHDLIEASWQFLYDITDIVTTRFTAEDRDEALSLGKVLLQNGGNYEHVVEYGIRHNLGRSEGKESGIAKGV